MSINYQNRRMPTLKGLYPDGWPQWDSPSTLCAELDKTDPWLQMLPCGHPHEETKDKRTHQK